MSEGITLQELTGLLAERRQMSQEDAETFVMAFFALIKDALIQDKYVKVKGLGTFKLIETETGEQSARHVHPSVSFVPDVSLRELINKPFSQFDAVELKDGVHFEDLPELDGKKISGTEETEDTAQKSESSNESLQSFSCDEKMDDMERVLVRKWFRFPWCLMAVILFVGIVLGGSIVWTLVSGRRYIPEAAVKYLEAEERSVSDTTIRMHDSERVVLQTAPMNQETAGTEISVPAKAEAEMKVFPDTVRYEMKATHTTYTVHKGESLAKIAQRFYGNRKLWPYLARFNKKIIPNPDNVPVGTVIRIPELVPKN